MDKYVDNFIHGVKVCISNLGVATRSMTEVHWALFAVLVIGTGVIFLKGNTVKGA